MQLYLPFVSQRAHLEADCCFAGASRLINGQLVSSSVDVYIVFEYCELGDLFHYRSDALP